MFGLVSTFLGFSKAGVWTCWRGERSFDLLGRAREKFVDNEENYGNATELILFRVRNCAHELVGRDQRVVSVAGRDLLLSLCCLRACILCCSGYSLSFSLLVWSCFVVLRFDFMKIESFNNMFLYLLYIIIEFILSFGECMAIFSLLLLLLLSVCVRHEHLEN